MFQRPLLSHSAMRSQSVPATKAGAVTVGAVAVRARARMLIGEQRAVSELWEAARARLPAAREDRPGQPVYSISSPPEPAATGLRPAELRDLDLLVPTCARAHQTELGIDPLGPDPQALGRRQLELGEVVAREVAHEIRGTEDHPPVELLHPWHGTERV